MDSRDHALGEALLQAGLLSREWVAWAYDHPTRSAEHDLCAVLVVAGQLTEPQAQAARARASQGLPERVEVVLPQVSREDPALSFEGLADALPAELLSIAGAQRSYAPPPLAMPALALRALAALRDPERQAFVGIETLGEGGFGVVERSLQSRLQRQVAVKRIRRESLDGEAGERAFAMFLAEAVVTSRLDHPNIVSIYDLSWNARGDLELAMRILEGRSWASAMREVEPGARLGQASFQLETLATVSQAVAYAHSRGVVHCDLKPENVMIGDFGEVTVVDWGLAVTHLRGEAGERTGARAAETIVNPCGTPLYMAPELAMGEGERIGPWTDVFLLGAILFELLTGRPPFEAETLTAVLIQASQPFAPRFPKASPRELRRVCLKAMAFEPEQRYPDAGAFHEAIRDYLNHRESLIIAAAARDLVEACLELEPQDEASARRHQLQLYRDLSDAAAGFRQALNLWPENPEAYMGEEEARRLHAEVALACGDLGVASMLVASSDDELVEEREDAKLRERLAWERRRRDATVALSKATGVTILVAGCVGAAIVASLALVLWSFGGDERASAERIAAQAALEEERARGSESLAARAEAEAALEQVRAELSAASERDFQRELELTRRAGRIEQLEGRLKELVLERDRLQSQRVSAAAPLTAHPAGAARELTALIAAGERPFEEAGAALCEALAAARSPSLTGGGRSPANLSLCAASAALDVVAWVDGGQVWLLDLESQQLEELGPAPPNPTLLACARGRAAVSAPGEPVRLYRVRGPFKRREWRAPEEVWALAWAPGDSSLSLGCGEDLYLWEEDTEAPKPRASLAARGRTLSWDPSGERVAIELARGSIGRLDAADPSRVRRFRAGRGDLDLISLNLSQSGGRAAALTTRELLVIDLSCEGAFESAEPPPNALAALWLESGPELIVVTRSGIELWTLPLERSARLGFPEPIASAWGHGDSLLLRFEDGALRRYAFRASPRWEPHAEGFAALAATRPGWLLRGPRAAVADPEGGVVIWDSEPRLLNGEGSLTPPTAWLGELQLATLSQPDELRIWRAESGNLERVIKLPRPASWLVEDGLGGLILGGLTPGLTLALPDGTTIAAEAPPAPVLAITRAPEPQAWLAATDSQLLRLKLDFPEVRSERIARIPPQTTCLQLGPKGRIAIGDAAGGVLLLDPRGEPVWASPGAGSPLRELVFSADGIALCGLSDAGPQRWDAATGAPLAPAAELRADALAARSGGLFLRRRGRATLYSARRRARLLEVGAAPMAASLPDDALAVGQGRSISLLSILRGEEIAQHACSDTISALLGLGNDLIAATAAGLITRWSPANAPAPTTIAELGERVDGLLYGGAPEQLVAVTPTGVTLITLDSARPPLRLQITQPASRWAAASGYLRLDDQRTLDLAAARSLGPLRPSDRKMELERRLLGDAPR